jgi:hypothetical protein
MHSDIADLTVCDSVITCEVIVYNRKPFKVFFQFIKRDDELVLTGIKNLGTLYTRLNCLKSPEQKTAIELNH